MGKKEHHLRTSRLPTPVLSESRHSEEETSDIDISDTETDTGADTEADTGNE